MARIFLAIVGGAYLLLAAWCAARPEQTAASVGYDLASGSGRSEYFTVYGGLQIGLGLLFLWPLIRPESTPTVLTACLIVHAAIVVFRSLSFALFADIRSTTFILAGVEWAILIASAVVAWLSTRS
jgi:hypothetical protein